MTLTLADSGQTEYKIVIAAEAPEGIRYAAEELTLFLNEMTGAAFETVDDAQPAGDFELVLGETNRKTLDDVPGELRPQTLEGLVILPEGSRLFIMSNSTRGTLYGVYDWLERDLGVRFLANGPTSIENGEVTVGAVNYVPQRPTLRMDLAARRYDPPFEYRNLCWAPLSDTWSVRRRLNAVWESVPMQEALGGVKWVGPTFVHTFEHLVPTEVYFDEHPEYFSLIDGERQREYDGLWTQLCLTNPDVLRIATERVKEWVQAGQVHPDDKLIASVSVNDSHNHCKCEPCKAVNAEEGVDEGGTLIRFVNAIARAVRDDHPNVLIETLGYAGTKPTKTAPESNVIIRWVGAGPWDFEIDRHPSMEQLLRWESLIGDGGLYSWFNLPVTEQMLYPVPNLAFMDHNLRVLAEHKVIGVYLLYTEGPGTDVFALRSYLMSQCLWRPETDGRKTIEEFCHLYYGEAAAPLILQYLDEIHANQLFSLRRRGRPVRGRTFSGSALRYANAMLAEAEAAAGTAVQKLRVAELRLQPWYFMVCEAFDAVGRLLRFPDTNWYFRYDGRTDDELRGNREGWATLSEFDECWRRIDIDRAWTFQGEERRGTAWYAIEFDMPVVDPSVKPALVLAAVDGSLDAWIDGEKIGERQGIPDDHIWQHHCLIPLAHAPTAGRHVLTVRVTKETQSAGIWKPVSIVDLAAPIAPELHEAAVRCLSVSKAIGMYRLSECYGPHERQMEEVFWPNLETFLKYRPKPSGG